MSNNNAINQQAFRKMANGIRLAFFLSLITNIFDIYDFISETGELREGMSIAFGILGTILLWQLSSTLRAEKKQALYYWLGLLFVGYIRYIFVDAAFTLNIFSMVLLLLAVTLTFRIVFWMRSGVLN
jgi:hypothetical protein